MITLYTIGCPKCKILEQKLLDKHLDFKKVSDVSVLEHKGFDLLPVLEVDGVEMDFSAAIKWINKV